MTIRLDISIGPVQGFVAQSRRTRDLWGSSYLLSFLSGHAMRGAEQAGACIVQPVVEKNSLYRWIGGKRDGDSPRIGSLPNRFEVEVEVNAAVIAGAVQSAFEAAWERVCAAVWEGFVKDACEHGDGVRAIWERQVGAFWEVGWASGVAEEGLLSRRKHWRSHWRPDEPGDKCTIIHDLQELSGHVRSTGSAGRVAQDRFWAHLCKRVGKLNLRDNERLCAVALVKRLFPLVSEDALGWRVERSRWPSTVHVAARPWLDRVETAAPRLARNYAKQVKRFAAASILSESRPPGRGAGESAVGEFSQLDANWFRSEAVENEQLCPLKDDNKTRDTLVKALKSIYRADGRNGHPLGPPSSFYALLLADGDQLGKLVGELGSKYVGQALTRFVEEVPEVVRRGDGETVYAGGDDVLAMLPAQGSLRNAAKLAESYGTAFNGLSEATLSASVVFVHIRYPLGAAIREAHRLLDDVAKDGNGRDSLAVGVLKPGGLNTQWVTKWKRPGPDGSCESSVALIEELVERLGTETSEPSLSSTLLYRIRELLVRIGGWDSWHPGAWGSVPGGFDVRMFLRAEIGHSLAVSGYESVEGPAEEMADIVWSLLRRASAVSEDEKTATEVGVDALLLARFLAGVRQGGDES